MIGMRALLKQWAISSKTVIIAYRIYDNRRLRRQFSSGNIETIHGSTHGRMSIAESLKYIDVQFEDYLAYSGLQFEHIAGKKVLELGFGDNLGVALKFIAAGALRVVCLDRFYSQRDPGHQLEIYRALRETLSKDQMIRFDAAINLADGRIREGFLKCIYGSSLEEFADDIRQEREMFDLIISRAVLEEIYQPDATFAAMNKLLAPGGYLLHKIDLSDYGIFRNGGMHPLTFLTIPEWIYRLMASDSGIPNRRRIGYYRRRMAQLGDEAKLFVTSIVGSGPLEPHQQKIELDIDYAPSTLELIARIRPKLSREYRALPDEDLIVDGIFLVASKPVPDTTEELVSIVMPAYNAARYLEAAVESVVAQTHGNWELLIVDDASLDNTLELAYSLKAGDARISVFTQDRNQGVAAARNRALENASGKYIAFLDSDDLWVPDKIKQQIEYMRRTGMLVSFGDYARIDEQDSCLGVVRPPSCVNYARLLKSNFIGNLTGMYNAEVLGKQVFSDFKHEDYVAWLALVKKAGQAGSVGRMLGYYRVYSGSTSSNKLKTAFWQWKIYRRSEALGWLRSIYLLAFYTFYALSKRL